MKSKILIGFFVLLVSTIMLMSNASGSGWPVAWINQATLSTIDLNPSQDPENSGYGTIQVVVWEEWNGADWDIWLSFSIADGILGSWALAPIQPAATFLNEINPAVAVTNANPITGVTEVHVVYQRDNPAVVGSWDICHTWAALGGWVWSAPVILDVAVNQDAIDPAIVYTEDFLTPGFNGMMVQIVWAEWNPNVVPARYEIQYDGYYQDTALVPMRGYMGPTLIRSTANGNCEFPEIASVDEGIIGGSTTFDFSVVWQEPTAAGQINIWYNAGTSTTSGGVFGTVLTAGALGQLNINPVGSGNSYHPDIAETQDYVIPGQGYYYHVIWVFNDIRPINPTWQIDETSVFPGASNPLAAAFAAPTTAQGPIAQVLDNPTIASKLISLGPPASVFETWMAWEDSTNPGATNPDIWFVVGSGPPFVYLMASARVGYIPPAGGGTTEFNPELWNRNDLVRAFPPLTHLVFDQTNVLGLNTPEVEYIDP